MLWRVLRQEGVGDIWGSNRSLGMVEMKLGVSILGSGGPSTGSGARICMDVRFVVVVVFPRGLGLPGSCPVAPRVQGGIPTG